MRTNDDRNVKLQVRREIIDFGWLQSELCDEKSREGRFDARRGGVLYIFWVRGCAIGNGIEFHDFGISTVIQSME